MAETECAENRVQMRTYGMGMNTNGPRPKHTLAAFLSWLTIDSLFLIDASQWVNVSWVAKAGHFAKTPVEDESKNKKHFQAKKHCFGSMLLATLKAVAIDPVLEYLTLNEIVSTIYSIDKWTMCGPKAYPVINKSLRVLNIK